MSLEVEYPTRTSVQKEELDNAVNSIISDFNRKNSSETAEVRIRNYDAELDQRIPPGPPAKQFTAEKNHSRIEPQRRPDILKNALDVTFGVEPLSSPSLSSIVGGFNSNSNSFKRESDQLEPPSNDDSGFSRNSKFEQYLKDTQSFFQSRDRREEKLPREKIIRRNERTPAGSRPSKIKSSSAKRKYEKYWCTVCQIWIGGGKALVSSHLRNRHEYEDCEIVYITSSGMLKVDKEDFLPDSKRDQANGSRSM